MRNSDPTINPIGQQCICYDFGITEGIMLGVSIISTVASVGMGLAGASQQQAAANAQAQAQMQQAENAKAIAGYNASIQRQNNEVSYQMALYQAQSNQNLAQLNMSAAIANQQMAELQGVGARRAYEQGLENAKQQELQAEATRAQSREAADRQRQENVQKLANIRSRYAASGVSFEGSPLEILSDAARLGESAVQDIAYAGELQSRKELRQGEIEKFKAGFSLIDEMGYKVEAQNLKNQATRYGYESSLYEYDSAIAGAKYRIGLNSAKLTELAGGAEAQALQYGAQQSILKGQAAFTEGVGSAIGTGFKGITSAYGNYSLSQGNLAGYSGYGSGRTVGDFMGGY